MIFASIVIFSTAHSCYAFNYDDIESIDDIYRYYYGGQIDQAQFEYLLETFDIGRLSSEDILALGIGEPAELTGIGDTISRLGVSGKFAQSRSRKAGVREHFESDGGSAGNYYLNFNRAETDYRLKLRSMDGRYFVDNRSVRLMRDSVYVELGNYLVSEGYGLTIGRFDYQPSAGYDRIYDFDFWSPINSYYNGVKTEFNSGDFASRVYLSSKYYPDIKKRFAGGGIMFRHNRLVVGISCGYNSLTIRMAEDARIAKGLNFTLSDRNYEIGGEFTQIKQSVGYYLSGARNDGYGIVEADFWSYARYFNSYNCSGKAAADYHSFYPTDEPVGFRAAQAGETGFAARLVRSYWAFGMQAWKQAERPELNLMAYTRLRAVLGDLAAVSNQINYSVKNNKGGFWLKGVVSNLSESHLKRFGVRVESDDSDIDNTTSYGFLTVANDFSENLVISAEIRGYFDGAWRTRIAEKALLAGGFRLDIELVFGHNWRASAIFEKAL